MITFHLCITATQISNSDSSSSQSINFTDSPDVAHSFELLDNNSDALADAAMDSNKTGGLSGREDGDLLKGEKPAFMERGRR